MFELKRGPRILIRAPDVPFFASEKVTFVKSAPYSKPKNDTLGVKMKMRQFSYGNIF